MYTSPLGDSKDTSPSGRDFMDGLVPVTFKKGPVWVESTPRFKSCSSLANNLFLAASYSTE